MGSSGSNVVAMVLAGKLGYSPETNPLHYVCV